MNGYPDEEQYSEEDFWMNSFASFTSIVIIVLLKLVIVSQNPFSQVTIGPTVATFVVFIIYVLCLSYSPLGHKVQPNMDGIPGKTLGDAHSILVIILTPLVAVFLDVVIRLLFRFMCPTALQRAENAELPLEALGGSRRRHSLGGV